MKPSVYIILVLNVALILSAVVLQEFLIAVLGILLEIIFISVRIKPKFLAKEIFSKRESRKSIKKTSYSNIEDFRINIKEVKFILENGLVLLIGIAVFTYLAIFQYQFSSSNLVSGYFNSAFKFFNENKAILLIFPVMLFLPVLLKRGLKKFKNRLIIKSTGLLAVSFCMPIILIYIIAFFHIWTAGMSYSDSKFISDSSKINEYIEKQSKTPKIYLFDEHGKKKFIIADIENFNGKSNFYEKTVLTKVPNSWFDSIKFPEKSIFIYKDTLIIKDLRQEAIEVISPTLGKTIVRLSLPQKNIKNEPKVDVLNRQEYLKFREDQINKKIEEIEGYIDDVQSYINVNYARINEAKSKIQANKNAIDQAIAYRDEAYNYCKSAGYNSIYFGFYRFYTDAECESKRRGWDGVITQNQKNINDWESDLKETRYYLSENLKIKEELLGYKDLIASQKNETPNELGIFLPERDIKLALDTTQKNYLKEYLATLIHEYLHYTSYVSDERILEHSLEEGLTEYFSRRIINQNFGEYKGVGYPIMVKIVEAISRKINYDGLLDIYFTKDQPRLETLLDKAYGKNFYKDSELYFQLINLLPADKATKVANNILVRMGEPPISEKDL